MITTRLCEVPVHFELCVVCVTIAQLQLYHGTISSLPLQCLPADELKGKSLSSDAQSRFVELLLYIPILEFAELKQIAALLRTGSLNSSSARYLLHLVDQRWEHLVHSGCKPRNTIKLNISTVGGLSSSVVDHTTTIPLKKTAADCQKFDII